MSIDRERPGIEDRGARPPHWKAQFGLSMGVGVMVYLADHDIARAIELAALVFGTVKDARDDSH